MRQEPKLSNRKSDIPKGSKAFTGKSPLVSMNLRLVDASGKSFFIKGNVEAGLNFIEAFAKVIVQNGGSASVEDDPKFGKWIKDVKLPHLGITIVDTGQFYINGGLPCKNVCGKKVWLSAENIRVKNDIDVDFKDDWMYTEDMPGGCGGSDYFDTRGLVFDDFELWDPMTDTVSKHSGSIFDSDGFETRKPDFPFQSFDAVKPMETQSTLFRVPVFDVQDFRQKISKFPSKINQTVTPSLQKPLEPTTVSDPKVPVQETQISISDPQFFEYIEDKNPTIKLTTEKKIWGRLYGLVVGESEVREIKNHKLIKQDPIQILMKMEENNDDITTDDENDSDSSYSFKPSPSKLHYSAHENSCFGPLMETEYSPISDKPIKKKKKKKLLKKVIPRQKKKLNSKPRNPKIKQKMKKPKKLLKKVPSKPRKFKKPKQKLRKLKKLKKPLKEVSKPKKIKLERKKKLKPQITVHKTKKPRKKLKSKKQILPKVLKKKKTVKKKKGKLIFSMLTSKKKKRKKRVKK